MDAKLRHGYIGFERSRGYFSAGIHVYRERPIDFWVILPLATEELRSRGLDVPDLYPNLAHRWTSNKEWA